VGVEFALRDPEEPPEEPVADEPAKRTAGKHVKRRRRRLLATGFAILAGLLLATGATGYVIFSHLNGNIRQADIRSMLGHQPADLRPRAQNILVLGSDTRQGQGFGYIPGSNTDQSDTLMVIHIPADRKWAEVMSIPRDSWVDIPSCKMSNGKMASPREFKINESFAIGNLYGNDAATGAACTVKTIEQDTGIYIDHFVVVDFNGFRDMVAALGGVPECNPTPIDDPASGLFLSAGRHMLTPAQALIYVRARYGLGNGSDLERITRQQAFMSSLIGRARGKLYDPFAIYGFVNAATRSLTIDSQLGGITGLYNLGRGLRGIPSSKITFFTVPNVPRGDGANVLWKQPDAHAIFSSLREDMPASQVVTAGPASSAALPATSAGLAGGSDAKFPASPAPPPGPPGLQQRTANQSICVG
jgi:LCP family protein required for cell wall assembly